MNTRKNQNSILVLATLGVYLGLVLVGATPQVWAQAATAKQFSVKDVEKKDELDTNPNSRPPADAIENYFYHVESFLSELKDLPSQSLSVALQIPFEVVRSTTLPCIKGDRVGLADGRNNVKSDLIWPVLSQLSNGLDNGYDLGDCLPNQKFNRATVNDLLIRFDQTAFYVEIKVQKRSSGAAEFLNTSLATELRNYDLTDATQIRRQIAASTSVRAENNQVFIVTRLPRAGLDTLLATDAK